MSRLSVIYLIFDSISFFLTPFLFAGRLLICQGCKGRIREGGGEKKYIFNFNFISYGVFAQLLCSKEMSSRTIWESSFFPNQALKYISRFRWLISPNSVWSYPVVFWCCLIRRVGSLAADPTRMRSELARQNRRANCQRPGGRKSFLSETFSWIEGESHSFAETVPFFLTCVTPLPVKGFWEYLLL